MKPGHSGIDFEKDAPLARINAESRGNLVKITVSSPESFKGFLIVVQDKDESQSGSPIGQFIVSGDGIKGIKCKGENSGASHSNPDLKSEISVDWIKPSQFSQNSVIIRATVVYEYSRADHVKMTYDL